MKKTIKFLIIFLLVSCQGGQMEKEFIQPIQNSEGSEIEQTVDSLLFGSSRPDTNKYDYLLSQDRNTFIKTLIDRIDVNRKISLYDFREKQNSYSSTMKIDRALVGIKVLCLLDLIVRDSNFVIKNENEFSCRHCIGALYKRNGSTLQIEDLKDAKEKSQIWFENFHDRSDQEILTEWNNWYLEWIEKL